MTKERQATSQTALQRAAARPYSATHHRASLTYAQFAQRCDLWSAALFALGVRRFVKALPKMATGKIQKFVLRGGQAAISRQ